MFRYITSLLRTPFVRDAGVLQAGQIYGMVVSFFTSILYVRLLGLQSYGEYAVIMAMTGTLGLLSGLGQRTVTVTLLAEAWGRKDEEAMAAVYRYYFYVSVIAVMILTALCLVLPQLSELFYGNQDAGILGRIVFLIMMIEIPWRLTVMRLQVSRHIRLMTLLEVTAATLKLAIAAVFLLLGFRVFGVLLAGLCTSAAFFLFSMLLLPFLNRRTGTPPLLRAFSIRGRHLLPAHIRDGLWVAVDKNLRNLYPSAFLFLLSLQVPANEMGLVNLGVKLSSLPYSFAIASISRLSSSVLPSIAHRGAGHLLQTTRRLITHTVALHLLTTLAGSACIVWLLPSVYGEHFRLAVYPFLAFVAIGMLPAFYAFCGPILRTYSKIYLSVLWNAAGLLLGALAYLLLAPAILPLRSLYVAAAVYQLTATLVILPTLKLLRTRE